MQVKNSNTHNWCCFIHKYQ